LYYKCVRFITSFRKVIFHIHHPIHYSTKSAETQGLCRNLYNILEELLTPIREKRQELEKDMDYVYKVLKDGTTYARGVAKVNLSKFKKAMQINYFE